MIVCNMGLNGICAAVSLPATPSSRTSPSSIRCTMGRTAAQMHAGKTAWGGCSMWWVGVCSVVFSSSDGGDEWRKKNGPREGQGSWIVRILWRRGLTLGAGQRAHGPDGAAAERIVPVGVAGGAGGADGQAARCQVHHFFCWQDQREETDVKGSRSTTPRTHRNTNADATCPHLPPPALAAGCRWARSRPPGPPGWP